MLPSDRAVVGPLEIDLGDLAVLEDGDALLADVDGDEQLALRGRERGATLRLAAAALRTGRGGVPAAGRAGGVRIAACRLLFARGRRSSPRLSPAVAAPGFLRPRPPRLPRRRFGFVGSLDWGAAASSAAAGVSSGSGPDWPDSSSRASSDALVSGGLPPEAEPRQRKTPSRWRAAATCLVRSRARSSLLIETLSGESMKCLEGEGSSDLPLGLRPVPDLASGPFTRREVQRGGKA